MELYMTRKKLEQLLPGTMWLNLTDVALTEARHKGVHALWCHLHQVLSWAKPIFGLDKRKMVATLAG